MPNTGTCSLCLQINVTLRNSHIIPEFCYKHIYTSKHKIKPIDLESPNEMAMEQKGYRERLLCQSCETKLSVWEKELSNLLEELITENYSRISVTKTIGHLHVSQINYDAIKKAALSILWRASISKHKLFAYYNLGKYQNELRNLLIQNAHIKWDEFPILITKTLLNGTFYPGILMMFEKSRYNQKQIIQSIMLNSFKFYFFFKGATKIPPEVSKFCLKDSGDIYIPNKSLENNFVTTTGLQRFQEDDVKKFYHKYH